MSSITIDDVLDAPFTFRPRHIAIPGDIRPVWRMYALALVIEKCWGSQASVEQLHVLNWALRTEETRTSFLRFLKGERSPNQIIVRFDPSLNRAVHFAFAEKIILRREKQKSLIDEPVESSNAYRMVLSGKGIKMVRHVRQMDDCLEREKAFLDSIPQKITQKQVAMLFTWGRA